MNEILKWYAEHSIHLLAEDGFELFEEELELLVELDIPEVTDLWELERLEMEAWEASINEVIDELEFNEFIGIEKAEA